MAALATVAELIERVGPDIDPTRAGALLDDASAAVRSYTGQTFERVTGQVVEVWPDGCCFELRGKDVADVTATFDAQPVTLERVGRYTWRSSVCRGPLAVTFDEGWTTVPDDIAAVVLSMTARALALDPSMVAVQQEVTGPFSVSIGAAAAQGGVGMLAGERAILDRYKTRPGAITAGVPFVAATSTWCDFCNDD